MRACAGSYTPHGRSQCAWTRRCGLRNASNMDGPPSSDDGTGGSDGTVSGSRSIETYHRGRKRVAGLGATAVAAAGVAWACLRWKPSRVEIEGGSMAPTLAPGDWAMVASPSRYERDDVVVVEHPGRPGYEMVKRIVGMPGDRVGDRTLADDEYWVVGDYEPASTDSRQFGPVRADELKAKVLLVYWPPDRRRRVR
ncbi:MAG TPA: S26 family signal peptidase [Actinomycetota bacterium]|nr:S26 family signal peptidase [Actinomycetota bacterium]